MSNEREMDMKKSEIYRAALMSVMQDNRMHDKFKLEVIRELQSQETIALILEDKGDEEQ